MKNLFVVDGASGTGKSDLLKWVSENNAHDVEYVVKATTRSKREYEYNDASFLLDLEFVDDAEFSRRRLEYSYSYGGYRYGFGRDQLNDLLTTAENVFVIVRNLGVLRKLIADYPFLSVVPVFIYTDQSELEQRLLAERLSRAMIDFRLTRSKEALRDYYAHPDAYRETIINNSSRHTFHNTVQKMIDKYAHMPSIDPHLVAVLMSFNPDNRKLDDYYEAMEAAVVSVSSLHRCHRIDKVPGSPRIASEFRALVARARCLIVDLTENKQNVYYELGYAQAVGKTCIITAEAGTEPSFYPREHKIIFYESVKDLRVKLSAELAGVLRSTGL